MSQGGDIGDLLKENFSGEDTGLGPVDGKVEDTPQQQTDNSSGPQTTEPSSSTQNPATQDDGGTKSEPQSEPAGTEPPTSSSEEETKTTVNYFGGESQSQEKAQSGQDIEISDDAVLNYLREKHGANIESIEGLATALQGQTDNQVFADEQIQKINDFVKQTGRSASDWFATQAQDYDSMSEEQLVKLRIRSEAPDLTEAQVQSIFEKEYFQGEDFDESDTAYGSAKLKRDASKFRQEFNEIKQRYATERVETPAQEQQASEPSFIEKNFESQEKFFERLNSEMNDVDAITFGEGDDAFEFGITDEHKRSFAEQLASNPEDLLSRYYDERGNFDVGQFFMHQVLLDNMDQLISAARSTAKSDATEQVVRDAKNTSLGAMTQQGDNGQKPSVQEQAANIMLKDLM